MPQAGQLLVSEQRDVRSGKPFAQPDERGRGHHGVAEPVHAAHEDAVRIEG